MIPQISVHLRVLAMAGVLTLAGVFSGSAKAQVTVLLRAPASNTAALACRQSLHETVATLGRSDVRLVDAGLYDKIADPIPLSMELQSPREESAISLTTVPFAFRDPEHFQAFLASDLLKELRLTDQMERFGRPWAAVAYGGFYQLFSGKRAMTEPAHFQSRFIGGAAHSWLYRRFNANGSAQALMFGDNSSADADTMQKNDNLMSAIETPLIEASKYNLGEKAGFLNLMFTAVNPVVFYTEGMNSLPFAVASRFGKWAEIAAQKCSSANLQQEQVELDALKAKKVTVVPADRAAFVTAGWAYGMSQANINWSIGDLDRLVRLGHESAREKAPSSIIPTLPTKQRAAFLAYSKSAEQTRRLVMQTAGLRERVESTWNDGLEALAEIVRQTPPSNQPPPKYYALAMRTLGARKPDATAAQAARQQAQQLLARTGKDPCQTDCASIVMQWVGAAQTLIDSGDKTAARQLLDAATTLTERIGPKSRLLDTDAWQERMLVLDGYMSLRPVDLGDILAAARRALPPRPQPETYVAAFASRTDRVIYLTQIGLMYLKAGDTKASDDTFAEAMNLAASTNSRNIAIAAVARWIAGDAKGAWLIGAQAVEQAADPFLLQSVLGALPAIRKVLASKSAELVRAMVDLEKAARVVTDDIVESSMADGAPDQGDWIDYSVVEAQLWRWANQRDGVDAVLNRLQSSQRDASVQKKIARAIFLVADIKASSEDWPLWRP